MAAQLVPQLPKLFVPDGGLWGPLVEATLPCCTHSEISSFKMTVGRGRTGKSDMLPTGWLGKLYKVRLSGLLGVLLPS